MRIELFYTPGCTKCAGATAVLKAAVQALSGVEWCEVDVLDDLDRAVDLGVLTLPALAVDGELVFTALPTAEQLVAELRRRDGVRGHGA
ncbi:thioredoxin family protein [Pseudomonas aeruginosa]|uniref:thioredoxin family protein n=1 Tax=Pseudomonas aeruginosa TaxID=287 RepID=UPI001ADF32CD|nr:glutaredoxin [Pseudomonas aeruginosa]